VKLPRPVACRAWLALLSLIAPPGPVDAAAPGTTAIVVTAAGQVAGSNGEIQSFKGIPYAAPEAAADASAADRQVAPHKGCP